MHLLPLPARYCILPYFCPSNRKWLGDVFKSAKKKSSSSSSGSKRRLLGRRRLEEASEGMALSDFDDPLVLGPVALKSGTKTIFEIKRTIIIAGIPVQLRSSLGVTYKVELQASLDIMLRKLTVSIIPSVAIVGEVAAGINLLLIIGEFGARLIIMRTYIIPTGQLLAGDSGYQACLFIDIKIEPLVSSVVPGCRLSLGSPSLLPSLHVRTRQLRCLQRIRSSSASTFTMLASALASGPPLTPPKQL